MERVASLFLLLMAGLSVEGVLEKDAKHEGCYPLTAGDYRVVETMTWDQCLYLCDHRVMNYAGVQVDGRFPTLNYCFCMNTLERSKESDSSLCGPCEEDSDKFCGGNYSVSVYKLAESRPLTLLVAIGYDLQEWRGNSSVALPDIPDYITSVDFHYKTDAVIYTTENQAYKTYYNVSLNNYGEPKRFLEQESISRDLQLQRILIDWLNNRCYFSGYFCCYHYAVLERDILGNSDNLFLRIYADKNIVTADFYMRLLFYIENGKLHSYNLNNGDSQSYSPYATETSIVKAVADVTQQLVFMVEYNPSNHYPYCLVSLSYNGINRRVLLKGHQLFKPETFDVYNNYIVWCNRGNEYNYEYVVFGCKLTPICHPEDIEMIRTVSSEIHDIKIYHPPPEVYSDPCIAMKCSDICTVSPVGRAECTCPETLVLGDDNRTCRENLRSLENVTYLGCYPERNNYKVLHSLSWEESLHFCDHRRTVYGAVQADSGASTFNFPFCSNNLLDNMAAVDSSLCQKCENLPDRYCGGNNTMSVYKLRESSPLTLLLATDDGIRIYSDETSSARDMKILSAPVIAIDFYLPQDKIFFASENCIWSTFFSPSSQMYVRATKLMDQRLIHGGLSVDWVNNETFFSNGYAAFKVDLKGKDLTDIGLHHGSSAKALCVDPYNRLLFFVQDNTLHSKDLNSGSSPKQYDNEHFHLKKVLNISVDIKQEIIYMIGEENEGQFRLVETDYNGARGRVLFKGAELEAPAALAVWGRQAVWVSNRGGLYTLYCCSLTPRCLPTGLRPLVIANQAIHDIKFYNVEIQTRYECGGPGCLHGCKGCTEPRQLSTVEPFTKTEGGKDLQVDESEDEIQEGLEEPTNHGHHSDDYESLTEFHKDYDTYQVTETVNQPKKGGNKSEVQNTKENVKTETGKYSFVEVFLVVGIFLIFVVVLVLLYVQLKPGKSLNQLGRSYVPSSELELN